MEYLLNAIQQQYGYDFFGYSKASLTRRIGVFLQKYGYQQINDCVSDIVSNEQIFLNFINIVCVHVTEMFRNPSFYLQLKKQLIPQLATYPFFNIWVAGCASGEEAYSIAILLHEANLLERCTLYATDICPITINDAKTGMLPIRLVRNYTQNYQQAGGQNSFVEYFHAQGQWALMAPFLRRSIHFMQHNLVVDQSFVEAQLIICRNVLIYFNQQLQDKVISLFLTSLATGGYLAFGDKESLQHLACRDRFDILDRQHRIYRAQTLN